MNANTCRARFSVDPSFEPPILSPILYPSCEKLISEVCAIVADSNDNESEITENNITFSIRREDNSINIPLACERGINDIHLIEFSSLMNDYMTTCYQSSSFRSFLSPISKNIQLVLEGGHCVEEDGNTFDETTDNTSMHLIVTALLHNMNSLRQKSYRGVPSATADLKYEFLGRCVDIFIISLHYVHLLKTVREYDEYLLELPLSNLPILMLFCLSELIYDERYCYLFIA
jgi:hypothetical protein